ncbi:MAG: hypothetical protein ABI351_09835 [Herbaspirillum sp.]
MIGKSLVTTVDCNNPTFLKTFAKLKPHQAKEARFMLGLLIMLDTDNPPGKLHFHSLQNKLAPSVLDPTKKVKIYTIHITNNDSHKASFTLESGVAYMRVCGEHDSIDKTP